MIYIDLFLVGSLFFIAGAYFGIWYSVRLLNQERLAKMADVAVNKALQTASSVRNLCEEYVYKAIKAYYPFPYNNEEVKAFLARKINLN